MSSGVSTGRRSHRAQAYFRSGPRKSWPSWATYRASSPMIAAEKIASRVAVPSVARSHPSRPAWALTTTPAPIVTMESAFAGIGKRIRPETSRVATNVTPVFVRSSAAHAQLAASVARMIWRTTWRSALIVMRILSEHGLRKAGEEMRGGVFDIRVERVTVRVHGDNGRKIGDTQMPHRLRGAEFEEMYTGHGVDAAGIVLRGPADSVQVDRAVLPESGECLRAHATLAHDRAHTVSPDDLRLIGFLAHARRRARGGDPVRAVPHHDGT